MPNVPRQSPFPRFVPLGLLLCATAVAHDETPTGNGAVPVKRELPLEQDLSVEQELPGAREGHAELPACLDGGVFLEGGELEGTKWEEWPGFEDLTGGVIYEGFTGDGSSEIANAFGFEAEDLYGAICSAERLDDAGFNGLFDALLLCEALNACDPYANAEFDFFVEAPEGSQFNGSVIGSAFGRSKFERQTALRTIHTSAAHEVATGRSVVVAVLDTRIDGTHSLLAGHVMAGRDFVEEDDRTPSGAIRFGHGTTVAGLVLAAAPNVSILPVRVLDDEARGTIGQLAAGIRWAADQRADVINLSLGTSVPSSAVDAAIDEAIAAGIIVVAAGGNGGARASLEYPANRWGVIAVTAAGRARFASGRAEADVFAPGTGVYGPFPGELWFKGTGTSFATALVSGGAALALEVRPAIRADEFVWLLPKARLDLPRLVR